jgi:hypothetical protein
MGDQVQQVQVTQKWYTKPQVLIPAAALGYMIYNKKTRKKTLTGGGSILMAIGAYNYITSKNDPLRGLNLLPAIAGGVMLALSRFSKSK